MAKLLPRLDAVGLLLMRMPNQSGNERPRVTVLVCTLNEAKNLPHVLPFIPDWIDEILVVDGRSRDETVSVVRRLLPTAHVVTQPGCGKGDALRFGVRQALGDVIVTLDADGETDPREIPRFISALLGGCEFAKGSRLASGRPQRMPLYRWLGNMVLTWTFNWLYGVQFTDVCSGLNAFWKKEFCRLSTTYAGCEMEQQLLARAVKAGIKVVEVPHLSGGRIMRWVLSVLGTAINAKAST
jgi:glycosyltransferase involved in cell wall biosynthesis